MGDENSIEWSAVVTAKILVRNGTRAVPSGRHGELLTGARRLMPDASRRERADFVALVAAEVRKLTA